MPVSVSMCGVCVRVSVSVEVWSACEGACECEHVCTSVSVYVSEHREMPTINSFD